MNMNNLFALTSVYTTIEVAFFFYLFLQCEKEMRIGCSIVLAFVYYFFLSSTNISRYVSVMQYSTTSMILILFSDLLLFFMEKRKLMDIVFLSVYPHLCIVVSRFLTILFFSFAHQVELYQLPVLMQQSRAVLFTTVLLETGLLFIPFLLQKNLKMIQVVVIPFDCLIQIVTNYFCFHVFGTYEFVLIVICVLSLLCAVGYYFHSSDELSFKKKENEELKAKLQDEQYYAIAKEDLHAMKHDLNHILSTIDTYVDKKEIAESYSDRLNEVYVPIQTGISYLDAILNSKAQRCYQNGIQFQTIIHVGDTISLDEEDLSVLLVNLLDNAIEHIGGGNEILFQMEVKKTYISIHLENSIDSSVLDENGEFKNVKKENGHGYGVSSIKNIVDKYNGSIRYREVKNHLDCDVILLIID